MEKNKNNLEYYFSTSFNVLEVRSNYQQMRQIIQVGQAFVNARKKKKMLRVRELGHEGQLKLEREFREYF